MNDNRKIVKIAYYIILTIIFSIIVSIVCILYGYIYKKNIGTAFNTHLENTLTSDNTLFSTKQGVEDIIKPSFIDIYMKNITDKKILLEDTEYKKYFVTINSIEIFGLKILGFSLLIVGIALMKQREMEDFTNVSFSSNSNINVLIISTIIFGFIAGFISIYLFVKFMKMRKILTIDTTDNELLLLRQGLLYEKLTDDIINIEGISESLQDKANIFNTKIDNQITSLYGPNIIDKKNALEDNKIKDYNNLILDEDNRIDNFYNANKGENGRLPAPFNGGNNKYSNIYTHVVYIGIGISGLSFFMIIICIAIIFKRAD